MRNIKHQMSTTIIATAFALTFVSGCGADVEPPAGDIGGGGQETQGPAESGPPAPVPSVDSAPCVFSAQAAERLGRPTCVH